MKQNNLTQIGLVTRWEFMHFFKWKQEIISKLIMILIAGIIFAWQYFKDDTFDVYQIAVANSNIQLEDTKKFKFKTVTPETQPETLINEESDYSGLLLLTTPSDKQIAAISLIAFDKQSWQAELNEEINKQYRKHAANSLNLNEDQVALLQEPVTIEQQYLDSAVKSDEETSDTIAVITLILMAVGIFTAFGQLFASVTGEKQQRVTEQLYSCISAQTWIDGKIFGQMLHALKAMITAGLSGLLFYAFMAVVVDGKALDFASIDWGFMPWLLLFSALGIYISTAFIAAIAAAIDDPNHSAKTGLMLLPLLPMILVFMTMDDASGWALSLLSYLPFTAFVAMPVKMSLIEVPWWQVVIAIASSLAFALWLRGAAARIFKMCMTMYGKEPDVTTMIVWMIKEPNYQ
ncbi:ABC transporter permease [Thalassotalea marina]|uniref:ABC-2 type transporter transmembrane domain-containing protein n=1 Tax=Thalassotalea marina TaxID=1673741 RepID=A0A919BR08_9GAMM|nr:ABC transporter permease [Thalassotalea marina]GHG04256.1 hypothetical protein GCM10017161_37200 [Thalassotalea marina]